MTMSTTQEPRQDDPFGYSSVARSIALRVTTLVEDGESHEQFHRSMLTFQQGIIAICPDCGKAWTPQMVSKTYARRLHNLASTASFQSLLRHLQERSDECFAECPTYGAGSR